MSAQETGVSAGDTIVRWDAQPELGIAPPVFRFEGAIISEDFTASRGAIANSELGQGQTMGRQLQGSFVIGGTINLTARISDLISLIGHTQIKSDSLALTPATDPPGPTGAYQHTLAPDQTTLQQVCIAVEIHRGDPGGAELLLDCQIENATINIADNSMVDMALTFNARLSTYWAPSAFLGLNDGPALQAIGWADVERMVSKRPGTTGDMVIEAVTEAVPGEEWTMRSALGQLGVFGVVDTTAASADLVDNTGTDDFRVKVFPDDWVGVVGEGTARKVASVTKDTITLDGPFPSTLVAAEVALVFGEPMVSGSAVFPLRTGRSPEDRVLFDEVIGGHDGYWIGEEAYRTKITTAGEPIPTGDLVTLPGTVSVTINTTAWTGSGASFLTNVAAGNTITGDDGVSFYTVAKVIDDDNLVVTEPHPAGFAGQTAKIRRQWLIPRERPRWAPVFAIEDPFTEIRVTVYGGKDFDELGEVEVDAVTITSALPLPPKAAIGIDPGITVPDGQRAITLTANAKLTVATQDMHDRLKGQNDVSMLIEMRSGSQVLPGIPDAEAQYRTTQPSLVIKGEHGQQADTKRYTASAGPGQATFPISVTFTGNPDVTMIATTQAADLLV